MTVYLNYGALAANRMRSNRLGPVDSIAHPLEPGRYLGTVWLEDTEYGRFAIEVGLEGDGAQIEIDLGGFSKQCDLAGPPSFNAASAGAQPVFAVFHSDNERGGFRVELMRSGEFIFDSAALGAGDYYILTPLKPGKWALHTSNGARGSVMVEQARPDDVSRASPAGFIIRTDGKSFEPAEATITSGDGLVFEITGSEVVIEVALEVEEDVLREKRPVGIRYVRPKNVSSQQEEQDQRGPVDGNQA